MATDPSSFSLLYPGQPPAPCLQPPGRSRGQLPAPCLQPPGFCRGQPPAPCLQPPGFCRGQLPAPCLQPPGFCRGQLPAPCLQPPGFCRGQPRHPGKAVIQGPGRNPLVPGASVEQGCRGQPRANPGVSPLAGTPRPRYGSTRQRNIRHGTSTWRLLDCTSAQANFLKLKSKQKVKRHTIFQFSL